MSQIDPAGISRKSKVVSRKCILLILRLTTYDLRLMLVPPLQEGRGILPVEGK